MAVIYLSSVDGADGDSGATWALAKATLGAALTAAGAGGTVYVDHAHAETQASAMTLTSPGTAASPVQVICVDRTGNPEPPTALATTASVSTTGANAISFVGVARVLGVNFNSGDGVSTGSMHFLSASSWFWSFENLTLRLRGTGASAFIICGGGTSSDNLAALELRNVIVDFGAVTNAILCRENFTWIGGSAARTAPTALFETVSQKNRGVVNVSGVDLSLLGSGNALVNVADTASYEFRNCKLGSSVSVTTGTAIGQNNLSVRMVNCDSADTNYRYQFTNYQGTITQESTIVRTGGASDGTTPISRKMVSTANTKIYSPLVLDDIVVWNDTTGSSKTATVEVVTDGVTLTDAECWVEVEYLGTSGFPISSLVHDRVTDPVFGTPANQTTSSETWTTTGLASPTKQKLAVSFTPQEKGPVRVRVMLAKASTTVYVDPLATIA